MTEVEAIHPRKQAQALLATGLEARVLEPSPPAVNDGEYKADDPVSIVDRDRSLRVVTPTSTGDVTWDELSREDRDLGDYAADHWLGAWKRLQPLPDTYLPTVSGLGQLAFFAIAPARFKKQAKIGLRYTYRGFGTPFFGRDRQIRIQDDMLVIQDGDVARATTITTIRKAAEAAGVEYLVTWGPDWHDPPKPTDPDTPLQLDRVSVRVCSDVVGFGHSTLEQIRAEAHPDEAPSRVQLWPEHFDAAVEIGKEDQNRRAGFGASPGYSAHPEPFLYVSPWSKDWLLDPYWNADFFGGSILTYPELLAADDQRETALSFFRTGLAFLRDR